MIEILFWVLLVIGFAFGFYRDRENFSPSNLVTFILFVLIGLTIFHNPLTK